MKTQFEVNKTKPFMLLIVIMQVMLSVSMFFNTRNELTFYIIVALSLIMLIKARVQRPRTIILVVAYLIIQYTLQAILYKYFSLAMLLRFMFVSFIFTYITYLAFRETYFEYFVLAIYYLSIMGLAFYVILLVAPSFKYFVWNMSERFKIDPLGESIIVYQIRRSGNFQYYGNLVRNGGFAWEAGMSAALATLALFINNIQKKPGHLRRSVVLIALTITTFSTAGVFTLILALSTYVKRKINPMLMVSLAIFSGVLIYFAYTRIPFVRDKIAIEIEYANSQKDSAAKNQAGRLSRALMFKDYFKDTLLVGKTFSQRFHQEAGFTTYGEFDYASVLGLFTLAMKYGFFFMVFYVSLIFKLTGMICQRWNYLNKLAMIFFPISIIISMMSQGVMIWSYPILVMLVYAIETPNMEPVTNA